MHKFFLWSTLLGCFCAHLYAQDLSTPRTPRRATYRPQRRTIPAPKPATKSEKSIDSYLINFGTHTEFYNAVQVDDNGGMRKLEIAPTVGFGLKIPMDSSFIFLPEINWVLPRSAGDSQIIKNLFMLRADIGYEPVEWFRVRMGTSIMWLNQHGRGGSAKVNNGNGTSTFYYPDENRSSINNTLDIGAEFLFSDNWSTRFQTYLYSVFKEDRRQLSYSLFLTYQWDRE